MIKPDDQKESTRIGYKKYNYRLRNSSKKYNIKYIQNNIKKKGNKIEKNNKV